METVVERVAGLDVHKEQVTACVRVPATAGKGREHLTETFSTTVAGSACVARLAGRAQGRAGRDGGHRRVLEAGVGDPGGPSSRACWSTPATSSRSPVARPTSRTPQWLCAACSRPGCCARVSCRPSRSATLRNLTRYRKTQIQRARSARLTGCTRSLQDTGHQARLRRHRHSRQVRARDARSAHRRHDRSRACSPISRKGKLRKKLPALREALEGRFDRRARRCRSARSSRTSTSSTRQIEQLSTAVIEEQIVPFAPAVELLCTIPGVGRRAAEVIIAEIGVDMSVFPTAKHLASWAGLCPGNDQSAGRRRSGKTPQGLQMARTGRSIETATGRDPLQGHLLSAQYARLRAQARSQQGHSVAV